MEAKKDKPQPKLFSTEGDDLVAKLRRGCEESGFVIVPAPLWCALDIYHTGRLVVRGVGRLFRYLMH